MAHEQGLGKTATAMKVSDAESLDEESSSEDNDGVTHDGNDPNENADDGEPVLESLALEMRKSTIEKHIADAKARLQQTTPERVARDFEYEPRSMLQASC